MTPRVEPGWVLACEGQGARLLPPTRLGDISRLIGALPAPSGDGLEIDALHPAVAQQAVVAHQVLTARSIAVEHGPPSGAVGQSLGEISAFVMAGALDLVTALELTRRRAEHAAAADDGTPWTMVAITRTPADVVAAAARAAGGWLVVRNAPDDTVVVVATPDLERFRAGAGVDATTSRALPVVHPYHTPRLAGAAASFRAYVRDVPVTPPSIAVVSAIGPTVVRTAADVRRSIVAGLTESVQWSAALALAARRWPGEPWWDCGPSGALRRFVWKNGLDLEWRVVESATSRRRHVERSAKPSLPVSGQR